MGNFLKLKFLTISLIAYLTIALAGEENKNFSATLTGAFNSMYIWRGINISDEFVFQPSLTNTYRWLSIGIWASTEEGEYAVDFTEVDYSLDLSFELKKLRLSGGSIYYTFPNTDADSTTEIYAKLGWDVSLSPSLTALYDVELAHGIYLLLALEHSFENLWEPTDFLTLSIKTGFTLGYGTAKHNEFYYRFDMPAFTDATFMLSLPLNAGESFALTPYASYSFLLDNGIRRRMENDDNFWYGVSLTYNL